jgi:hypothetical protein
LLHGDLGHSWEWPPILIKGRGVADNKYLRMILDCQIWSDTDPPCAINFAAKPFSGRRWGNSRCPYHRLAWNSLIANDRALPIDRLNSLLQAHIYAQFQ